MKKYLFIVIFIMIMVVLIGTLYSASGIDVNIGDVNGDGEITAADARLALRYSSRLDIPDVIQKYCADADGDGDVTAGDARQILRWSSRLDDLPLWATEGEDMKQFILYELTRDTCFQFIENPSLDILNTPGNASRINKYAEDSNRKTKVEFIYPNEGVCGYPLFMVFSNCFWQPIPRSLINFMGNKSKTEEFLVQNGVSGNVDSAILFCYDTIPPTIWVVADGENFFITIVERSDENEMIIIHGYKLYSHSAYLEKFAPREGMLIE